jgi:anti-anti-sigma factor
MSQGARAAAGEPRPKLSVVADGGHDDGVRITVSGEIDLHTEHVSDGNTVTLDLAGVPYCDSMGISALLRIRQACRQAGSRLVLVNLSAPVRTVLTITGLNAWLDLPVE